MDETSRICKGVDKVSWIALSGDAARPSRRYVRHMAVATTVPSIDVAAVEEHLARFAVSCPLCRAVDHMGVAQRVCWIEAGGDGANDSIQVIMIVCKRCGYLMPFAADRLLESSARLAA
jgi:hypothetical protein